MKKTLLILSVVAIFAFGSCTVDPGDPITNSFSVDATYSELVVENAFLVTVSDTATQITITAGENIMPKVIVKQNDGRLTIRLKNSLRVRTGDMTVILPYSANLTSVDLSGASVFRSAFPLKGQKVELDLSGASETYCDIDAQVVDLDMSGASLHTGNIIATTLVVDLSGSSDIEIMGQTVNLMIDLSGASVITRTVVGDRYGLACDRCEGSMSGSCDAYLHCDGTIVVDASGSSDLHYTGNASTSGSSTSGSSNIIHDVL